MKENTAKNFVLQLGSLVSLYVFLGALIAVVFGLITLAFPDAADNYWEVEGAQEGIRFGIAMLLVFFPTYIALTHAINNIRRKEHGVYLTLTKWLIYLSMFVGGSILLGDLVAVLYTFLNGEITTRFLLKAGTLLIVIGAALSYYVFDARGYWVQHKNHAYTAALIASAFVLMSLVFGFMNIQAPTEVREMRLDEQQVYDLQDMQYRIEEYYRTEGSVPTDVTSLYVNGSVPTAPEEREVYLYEVLGQNSYQLCATFAHESVDEYRHEGQYSWEHPSGRYCFERTITNEDVSTAKQL